MRQTSLHRGCGLSGLRVSRGTTGRGQSLSRFTRRGNGGRELTGCPAGSPSVWWNFGWHLAFCWLVIPLLVALYKRHSYLMRIYADRVSIKEGFWARDTSEFFIKDIRSIDVRQGVWGRMVGIGDVTISTAATVEAAETASGVAEPNQIKDMLIAQRQQSPI